MSVRPLIAVLAAGWIAQALASTDRDVDAGVEAYEVGDYEEALARFDAAQQRLGERPEIHYDRGLALQGAGKNEEAREAFERGTESDDARVRASSHYQLGNLAFDAEQWEAAIAQYSACLRAMPEHENAKWNLELALQRKKEQEEEQEKQDQEKQDQDKQDQDQQDQENQDQEEQDQEEQDRENQDQEEQDQENQDQEEQDQEKQDQEQEQEQEQQEQEQQEQEQQEQEQQEQEQQEQEQQEQPAPQPIDQADIDAALEQLDASDQFMLGRPAGRRPKVERDW